MIQQQLTIKNLRGVHTRVAAKLVDTAKQFTSRIDLIYRDRKVDCKSIMSVITIGAQHESIIELVIDGEDENEALLALTTLIDGKFGEE
jgi:phosphocarrier protein HPr